MIENAIELAKVLDVDFMHLQKVWATFILDQYKSTEDVINVLRRSLTEHEMDFLLYIGLNSISDHINTTIHNQRLEDYES